MIDGIRVIRNNDNETIVMSVEDALLRNIPEGKSLFTFTPFANACDNIDSTDTPLNLVEMQKLKFRINAIKNEFRELHLYLTNDKKEIAKAIYI